MENLTLNELPPGGGPSELSQAPPPVPAGVPQLPPQMFTTAAQLLDLTDKKLLLILRDGRKLMGVLRSWDQFANLVLQNTVERIFVKDLYTDIKRGIFLVRGENVLLLGEIDLDKDDYVPGNFREASAEEVHHLTKQQMNSRKKNEKLRIKKLGALGFEVEHAGEVLF